MHRISLKIYVAYITISMLIALVLSYFDQPTVFSYSEIVSPEAIYNATIASLSLIFFIYIGYRMAEFISFGENLLNKVVPFPSVRRHVPKSYWFVVLLLFFLYAGKIVFAASTEDGFEGRLFESKMSFIYLSILAYIGYNVLSFKRSTLIATIVMFIGSLVVYIDASRSGLIVITSLLIGCIINKRYGLLPILAFSYTLSIIGLQTRFIDDRLSLNVLVDYFLFFDTNFLEFCFFVSDYFFAFSFYNFAYMTFDSYIYDTSSFFSAINPLPADFIENYDPSAFKTADGVRGVGAPAEIYLTGGLLLLNLFGLLIGYLLAFFDSCRLSRFYPLIITITFLSIIFFFQYTLRGYLRTMEIAVLVALFSKFDWRAFFLSHFRYRT